MRSQPAATAHRRPPFPTTRNTPARRRHGQQHHARAHPVDRPIANNTTALAGPVAAAATAAVVVQPRMRRRRTTRALRTVSSSLYVPRHTSRHPRTEEASVPRGLLPPRHDDVPSSFPFAVAIHRRRQGVQGIHSTLPRVMILIVSCHVMFIKSLERMMKDVNTPHFLDVMLRYGLFVE